MMAIRKSTDLGEDDFPDECGDDGINMPYFNLINMNNEVLKREKVLENDT